MNFTSDEEINIPFIRLTSHNDVFKCIGLRQTFCNNQGIYFLRLKLPVISYKVGRSICNENIWVLPPNEICAT